MFLLPTRIERRNSRWAIVLERTGDDLAYSETLHEARQAEAAIQRSFPEARLQGKLPAAEMLRALKASGLITRFRKSPLQRPLAELVVVAPTGEEVDQLAPAAIARCPYCAGDVAHLSTIINPLDPMDVFIVRGCTGCDASCYEEVGQEPTWMRGAPIARLALAA